jgi:hypothetical protein
VRDVGALRRLRGQRRALGDDRTTGDDPLDERHDHHVDGHDHDDDRSQDHGDDHGAYRCDDADHGEVGHAHDRLHTPDDRAGRDDDGLSLDAVRSNGLFLGR